jgi:hypothetical protein
VRRRARVDANHASIVKALRSCGWVVVDTSRLGSGFPDLVAARGGRLELIEIKDGAKPLSAQKLTDAEARFYERLSAAGVEIRYINAVEQVAAL